MYTDRCGDESDEPERCAQCHKPLDATELHSDVECDNCGHGLWEAEDLIGPEQWARMQAQYAQDLEEWNRLQQEAQA